MIPTFTQVWNQYGYKVGKRAAQKAWQKIPPIEQETMVKKIIDYIKTKPDWQSQLHLSTYLNQGRYNDEYPEFTGIPKEPDLSYENAITDVLELQRVRKFWRLNGYEKIEIGGGQVQVSYQWRKC